MDYLASRNACTSLLPGKADENETDLAGWVAATASGVRPERRKSFAGVQERAIGRCLSSA
jgi:hypothetical protein